MHNHIAVVNEHPLLLASTLNTKRRTTRGLTHLGLNLVGDGTHKAAVRGTSDHKKLGDGQDRTHLEHQGVGSHFVVGGTGRDDGQVLGAQVSIHIRTTR